MLQFVLVEGGIRTRNDFKSLKEIHQHQILITFHKYLGKKITLSKILTLNSSIELWKVSNQNDSSVSYDFCQINFLGGLLFKSNSLQFIARKEDPCTFKSLDTGLSTAFIDNLNNAKRIEICEKRFRANECYEVDDFISSAFLPDSISGWRSFLKTYKVSEIFINQYSRYFDKKCWEAIGVNSILSSGMIRKYCNKLGWTNISSYQSMDEELIREFESCVDWKFISIRQELTISFIREFESKVSWDDIVNHQAVSTEFVRENRSRLNFHNIKVKSLDFVYEFEKENLNWLYIVSNLVIVEQFVRNFVSHFNSNCWAVISKRCKLSSKFLKQYAKKIDWGAYSENQFISDEQLIKFKDKIDWNRLSKLGRSLTENQLQLVQDSISNQKHIARATWKNIFKDRKRFSVSESYRLSVVNSLRAITK